MTIVSIVIDVLLVALFLFFIIIFSKYGFARTIDRIGKTWMSVFTSVILGPFVSTRIHDWFLGTAFTNGVKNTLITIVEENPNGYSLSELFQNLPEGMLRFLNNYDISLVELEATYGSATVANDAILQAIAERIAEPCATTVAKIAGHVICLVFSLLFFKWLDFEIKKRALPFFRYVDHVTGFLIGIAVGYCSVLGVSLLLNTIFQSVVAFDANSGVVTVYENSYIFRYISEFDLWATVKMLWHKVTG